MAEKRLISYDVLMKHLYSCIKEGKGLSKSVCVAIKCFVEQMPTVDAVEVVRCKYCAKNGLFTCPICFIENKTLQFVNHSPDFYCGEGERRTDG